MYVSKTFELTFILYDLEIMVTMIYNGEDSSTQRMGLK